MNDELKYPSKERLTIEALRERERCLEIVLRFKMINVDYGDPNNRNYINGINDTISGIAFGISRGISYVDTSRVADDFEEEYQLEGNLEGYINGIYPVDT